jgi:hypothetical protein
VASSVLLDRLARSDNVLWVRCLTKSRGATEVVVELSLGTYVQGISASVSSIDVHELERSRVSVRSGAGTCP